MGATLNAMLHAAAQGDAQAWKWLVETYSGRVYGLIYRQCGNGELAEEVTQAAFVKVARKLKEYQDRGRFDSWLFRVAMNQLRDELRRQKRHASPMDFDTTPPESLGVVSSEIGPDAALLAAEKRQALREAIAQLSQADQEIIHMRYTAELSFAQIAETLGQPLGTVLARGHRALKKLKDKLQTDD